MKLKGFLAVATLALAIPALAQAEKPAQGMNKGPRGHSAAPARDAASQVAVPVRRAPVVAAWDQVQACPPGLAKKSPACVPPGQARMGLVGRVMDWRDVHLVRKPGLYGLGQPPNGQRYAVVDGRLVRIDAGTAKVLSVIRTVDAILD